MTTSSNAPICFEIKSQLAKLLATENITMRHVSGSPTAYFDVKARTLILPVWENVSEDLYDMLVVHEVGHALDTDATKWIDAIDAISAKAYGETVTEKQKSLVKDFLNVVEDARIDKRQKRRYPGSRRNYVNGFRELHERDFFGIDNQDVNSLQFIDRANIYFKGGVGMDIKFSETEKQYIARMERVEKFEEVEKLTAEIFNYARTVETSLNELTAEIFNYARTVETSLNKSMLDRDEVEGFSEEWSGDLDDLHEDATLADRPINVGRDRNVSPVLTEEAARANQNQIIRSDNLNLIYVTLPTVNHSAIVDDYKVVMRDCLQEIEDCRVKAPNKYQACVDQYAAWRRAETDTISFMAKEFELKQAASSYARSAVSKTGVIDSNKLHSYKFNEDVFRRTTNVNAGKNHGFVIFLDWSGSMRSNLIATMKQLFSFVLFCKRIQVPFEVYLFRSLSIGDEIAKYCFESDLSAPYLQFEKFKLRNILSSRMSFADLNKMLVALYYISGRGGAKRDPLGCTPLNEALLCADFVVNEFRKDNKVDIVNTIVMTDGTSDPVALVNSNSSHSKQNCVVIYDPVTKKSYFDVSARNGDDRLTTILARVLRERTGVSLIGIYLTDSSYYRLIY
jgi:hypothetical protein